MADEITFAQIEGTYSFDYWLARENMITALFAVNNVLGMVKSSSLVGIASDAQRFSKPPALSASALTDGTDMSNTAYTATSQTVNVAEVGLLLELTDLAAGSQIVDFAQYGRDAGAAVAEKLTTDITALLAAFSGGVGSTTVNLTEQNFLDAITTLRAAKVNEGLGAILHPQQENDLIISVGSAVTAAGTTGTSPRAVTNDFVASAMGEMGNWFNVATVTNATVPTANAGADRAGGMFSRDAIAYVEKWAIRPELDRNASKRSTEVAVTAAYGVAEIDDARGVNITTDA